MFRLLMKDLGFLKLEKEKIFEKYYRGSQGKIKGTGLGLYLTKKIVEGT